MPSHNHVTLMGNLTRNPELRYTPNGTPVCNLGLAVNRRYKQGDDLKEEVAFIDIVLFGKTGETAVQYLSKGDCALFEGRLQQRRWETEDHQVRSKIEVVAHGMTFIKTKYQQQGAGPSSGGADPPQEHHDDAPYE